MDMKPMLFAKFMANIGAVDGIIETGTVRTCSGDNADGDWH